MVCSSVVPSYLRIVIYNEIRRVFFLISCYVRVVFSDPLKIVISSSRRLFFPSRRTWCISRLRVCSFKGTAALRRTGHYDDDTEVVVGRRPSEASSGVGEQAAPPSDPALRRSTGIGEIQVNEGDHATQALGERRWVASSNVGSPR